MTLTGKDAIDFLDQIERERLRKKAERLARAKEDAAARGKEPFDLAKLETMCATEPLGRMSLEERQERFESMYYTQFPEIMTLEELAAKVTELGRWS